MQTGPKEGILIWNSGLNEGLGILYGWNYLLVPSWPAKPWTSRVKLKGAKMQKKKKKKKKEREREWKQRRGIYQGLSETVGQGTQNRLYWYNICVFHCPKGHQKFALVQLGASDFLFKQFGYFTPVIQT